MVLRSFFPIVGAIADLFCNLSLAKGGTVAVILCASTAIVAVPGGVVVDDCGPMKILHFVTAAVSICSCREDGDQRDFRREQRIWQNRMLYFLPRTRLLRFLFPLCGTRTGEPAATVVLHGKEKSNLTMLLVCI